MDDVTTTQFSLEGGLTTMPNGLASKFMLDLAAAHLGDQQRTARDRSQAAAVRRSRSTRRLSRRTR